MGALSRETLLSLPPPDAHVAGHAVSPGLAQLFQRDRGLTLLTGGAGLGVNHPDGPAGFDIARGDGAVRAQDLAAATVTPVAASTPAVTPMATDRKVWFMGPLHPC